MEQKGGLIDMQKFYKEMIEIQLQEALDVCLQKTEEFLPYTKYSDAQREEVCDFIIENRDQLLNHGYKDTRDFLKMFVEMINNLIERENISLDIAFGVVMRASARLIQ